MEIRPFTTWPHQLALVAEISCRIPVRMHSKSGDGAPLCPAAKTAEAIESLDNND
jgi:hypothetical protein